MKFKSCLIPTKEKFNEIHADATKRKKFFLFYKLIWIFIFILVILSSVLFTLSGMAWNEDGGFPTDTSLKIGYLSGGMIIFILALLLAIDLGFFVLVSFRETQNKFIQSEKFRTIKQQYEQDNALDGMKKRKLKELKKMKFIDKNQFSQRISLLKTPKKNNKKEKNSV